MKQSKLYTNTVSPLLLESFFKISKIPHLDSFKLVGGTALSLLLGHRMSVDLDLFTDQEYGSFNNIDFEENLSKLFPFYKRNSIGNFGLGGTYYIGNSEKESIKLDVFYTEPFISKGIILEKDVLPIASLEDIIPMKLEAIMNRGSKKDYWDLHEILEYYDLSEVVELYEKKYPYNTLENLEETLLLFERAEKDFEPVCLKGKFWDVIKWDIEEIIKENQLRDRKIIKH